MQAKWSRDQITVVTIIALVLMTVAALVDETTPSASTSAKSGVTAFVDGMDVVPAYFQIWHNPWSVKK